MLKPALKSAFPWLVILIVLLLPVFAAPVMAGQMNVEEAYKFGHYKRTLFDPAKSNIKSKEDVQFLQQMFRVSDNVLLSRVMVLQNIYTGDGSDAVDYTLNMTELAGLLQKTKAPKNLENIKKLMLETIGEQQSFMTRWAGSPLAEKRKIEKAYDAQPAVLNSNRKVQQIYSELVKTFPEESAYNKQAFFDHLYALDLLN